MRSKCRHRPRPPIVLREESRAGLTRSVDRIRVAARLNSGRGSRAEAIPDPDDACSTMKRARSWNQQTRTREDYDTDGRGQGEVRGEEGRGSQTRARDGPAPPSRRAPTSPRTAWAVRPSGLGTSRKVSERSLPPLARSREGPRRSGRGGRRWRDRRAASHPGSRSRVGRLGGAPPPPGGQPAGR